MKQETAVLDKCQPRREPSRGRCPVYGAEKQAFEVDLSGSNSSEREDSVNEDC